MPEKREVRKTSILLISIFIGVALIISASYINYKSVQEHVITKEQQQLLTISKSISKSLERFFDYHSENLKIISKNRLFREQFQKLMESNDNNTKFYSLEDYYIIQADNIAKVQLIRPDLQVIDNYPKEASSMYPYLYQDIEKVFQRRSSVFSRVYPYEGGFYIRLYEPVFYKSKIEAIMCIEFDLEKIYNRFVKPIRVGEKGYASVKDQYGILLMHPKKEDLGTHVIKARKEEFPYYDWSELEELVEKQMNGESGVGIYHSIWYHDKVRKRIKKFSAYSPARIGDQFWIITVSMDYLEMTEFIRNRTYYTIALNFIIILIFIAGMFYIYKIKKDKRQLEKEASLLKQVNELNKELEEDIEQRKILEKEMIKSKEKYERLFNSGSDCIFVLNLDEKNLPTEFLEVNRKACKSLDYDKGTLLNMSYLDISKDGNEEKFNNIVETLKRDRIIIFEDTLISRIGKLTPVEISAHLFKLENQLKMILISRDITSRKIQEDALRRSEERFRKIINQVATEISEEANPKYIDIYDTDQKTNTYYSEIENKNRIALELEEINIKLEKMFQNEVDENSKKEALMIYQSRLAAMGEMIGNIAHQWRQPLSGLGLIFSNIEDAHNYGELTDEYLAGLIQKSKKLIRRMSQTIDDFRYFFNPKGEEEAFSIQENIKQTIDFLDEHLRFNEISLSIDVEEDGMIYGHSNQYSQVIFNIVQNAVDALIENRLNGRRIDIRIFPNGFEQVVEIQDNAKGIDESIIGDVFEPYFTTKSKGKGTGLGLYMSKVIIEKNFQGHINITNQNDGLCVSITVPRSGVDSNEE
ncbi:ATP-binding protein [Wukongibacter baidiensis]|uniref:ATP-binding protein n=1 Tax=Wukongibacter baidiensis TaxID=1723361 RepID=UPI003D7FBB53